MKRLNTRTINFYHKLLFVPGAILFLFSCQTKNSQSGAGGPGPNGIESAGHLVSADSMAPPLTRPAGKQQPVAFGKPVTVTMQGNVRPAGAPKVVRAGLPVICTPGKDSFLLPASVPARGKKYTSGQPPSFVVKDAIISEPNPFSFSSFNKVHGFRHGHVLDILEDKRGNLWFGGRGGALRYDGRNFTQFTMKEGLPDLRVSCVLQDKGHNIWFGTFGGGMAKYDGVSFTSYGVDEGLAGNVVWSLFEDPRGNLWISTDKGGVSKFDGRTFTNYTRQQGLVGGVVSFITTDRGGNMVFASDSGISKYDGAAFHNWTQKEGLPVHPFRGLMDRKGNLWMGSIAEGVCKFDGQAFTLYTTREGLVHNYVVEILEDRRGNLWMGTVGGGLSKFDGTHFSSFSKKEGLADNYIWSMREDKNGNLWFGTNNGVFNYKGNVFRHFVGGESLPHDWVLKIVADNSQNLWIGTNGGGYARLDQPSPQTGSVRFTTYSATPNDRINLTRSMLKDSKGNLWIGTQGGVIKHGGHSITQLTTKEGLPAGEITGLLEDKTGNLWFATGDKGLARYDGKTFSIFSKKQGLPADEITCIMQDRQGVFWIGTLGGLAKITFSGLGDSAPYSVVWFTKKEGLNSNIVAAVLEDKNGVIWVATPEGVNRLEARGKGKAGKYFVTQFGEKDGLSYAHVNSILEDRKGNLWFGTRYGLNKLVREGATTGSQTGGDASSSGNIHFEAYTYEDGFLGKGINHGGLFEAADGAIWICADDRLTVFYPDGDNVIPAPPQIQLTSIQLFNRQIPWSAVNNKQDTSLVLENGVRLSGLSFDSLSKWNYLPQNLSLGYNNNDLTFSFVGITMFQPRKVRYQYTLEGLEKGWSALTSRTEATYGNLPHGSYTFKVRAVNSQGAWSGVYRYAFTIRPPWWHTWWAYLFYGLLFCGALWLLDRYRRRRILEKERAQARNRELAQAQEIEKAYHQLKAAQSQLIQSEKMASLGELTAGIAHEIQNPLNFINNFSEVNNELIDELNEELANENIAEAKAIATDIKGNNEKIMHHGNRADSIVKNMLQHSRKNSGQKEPVNINALAEEYLRLSYHGLRAKDKSFNVTMETNLDESIGPIDIVSQDISRVLLNLFNNAFYAVNEKMKTNPNGYKPLVTLTTKKLGSTVVIEVKDNGMGIPQPLIEKIYQPFFTTKPTGEGTGLGLSMSYDIIKKGHGGELKVTSKEGEFASFEIILPV